jgi:type IV pilus assembly protein PilO
MAKLDIRNLPKPVKVAMAVLPSIILVVSVYFMVIKPKYATIEKLKGEIAKQEQDISKAQSMVARLEELKIENARLKAELKALEEFLPAEKEISNLLKQVEELVMESELALLSWNPSPKRMHSSGIVYEVPVSISLNGSYHNLAIFFSELTKIDRIVNVNNINMAGARAKGTTAMLSVSFSAVTFTAVEEGQAAQQTGGK